MYTNIPFIFNSNSGLWVLLFGSFSTIVVTAFTEMLSLKSKNALIFWRWKFSLPSHHVFTVHAERMEQIDLKALKEAYGPFPDDPKDQHTLWMRMYRDVKNQPKIMQANEDYILFRDWACISIILMPIFGGINLFFSLSLKKLIICQIFLILQYLLALVVARSSAKRILAYVLAQASER